MYDEPPDPEPNPCPFCEEELGTNDSCDHCKLVQCHAKTEDALNTLRHKLGARARNLAWLPPGPEYAARRAEGIALLLDAAGLKLPDYYRLQALAAMTGEYGESVPYQAGGPGELGRNVSDEAIVERFMQFVHGEHAAASPTVFTAELLDAKPATTGDQLWWGDDENGVPRIFSGTERRLLGLACGTQWGSTLRETIEAALGREAGTAAFWLEFYGEYLQPPASLIPKEDPRFVRGGDQPKVSFVVGIEAYTAYVGKHRSERWSNQGLGFGGAPFTVRLADGREFFTDNNWSRGTVPPKLRKLLRSNAVFVTAAAAAVNAEQPAAA